MDDSKPNRLEQAFDRVAEGDLVSASILMVKHVKDALDTPPAPVTTCKLYIGNLPFEVTEDEIKKTFSEIGNIFQVELAKNKAGKSKGFGFVTYTTVDEAKLAALHFHNAKWKGRSIVVSGTKEQKRLD